MILVIAEPILLVSISIRVLLAVVVVEKAVVVVVVMVVVVPLKQLEFSVEQTNRHEPNNSSLDKYKTRAANIHSREGPKRPCMR